MEFQEKIRLIDECLEEPHSMDDKWLEMIKEYRQMLIEKEKDNEG